MSPSSEHRHDASVHCGLFDADHDVRSMDAINRESARLLRMLGDTGESAGGEQQRIRAEVLPHRPRALRAAARSHCVQEDCRLCSSPDGQEECLYYFGTLAPQVKAVLMVLHTEMWKLGMSNAAMHNEVAPKQHEISQIFALSKVSADQHSLWKTFCPNAPANMVSRCCFIVGSTEPRLGSLSSPLPNRPLRAIDSASG